MKTEEIIRLVTINIIDEDTKKVKGSVQFFLLANKAFIFSLMGKDIMSLLDKETVTLLSKKHNVDHIEFVMEPKTVRLLSYRFKDLDIGKEVILANKKMNWVTINL